MELIDLIDLTEGHDFEVKKAGGRDGHGQLPGSFFETYSAMANTEGGVVLLGVDESPTNHFNLVGIADPPKVIKELWNGLNNREKTSVNILSETDVKIVTVEKHQLVQITIPRATRHQCRCLLARIHF
jgi:ATP-dependent DNA helicase RecG